MNVWETLWNVWQIRENGRKALESLSKTLGSGSPIPENQPNIPKNFPPTLTEKVFFTRPFARRFTDKADKPLLCKQKISRFLIKCKAKM